MHIPENYLNPAACTVMLAAMFPVWKVSIDKVKIQIKKRPAMAPMIGIGAAYSFLIMMFNFPLPGGTTAHAVGGTLLACLIGPYAACLSVSLAILMQAFLFGDGGILAIGANTFNMAFIMPFVGYGIYYLFARKKHDVLGSAIGSYFGIVFAALSASTELGLQPLLSHTSAGIPNYFPYGLNITVPIMVGSHLIVGIIEAFICVCIYSFVRKIAKDTIYFFSGINTNYSFERTDKSNLPNFYKKILIFLGILALFTPVGLLANGTAWGEWSDKELVHMLKVQQISNSLPKGISHGWHYKALFSEYQVSSINNYLAYLLIALTIVAFVLILVKVCSHEKRE